ncbi:hypothetical protein AAFC00_002444 [Neodothiora populina]|uniref:Ubiquitin 3 binding protein But2 C-terminal domain-containing protein n=1 Tax=Neodothiora populina TaxID=2781224 RepID=A0ABR3P8G1_9PEZI
MKTAFTPLGFVLGASAAALVPRDQCCFSLTAAGGVSGSVGQLGDGQNRIAQSGGLDKQNGQYCLSDGKITDGNGRGCILTPPTTQFQCDVGASPTGGFSVSNGGLTYNGNSKFYACPTGDNGGYNIYTQPVENQQACVSITLSTGGKCSSGGSSAPASSAPASSAPASSAPASSAPASSAPASSAPVSSAPAPSAPASSAPASSAPAPSAPAESQATHTVYSTHYATITSCGAEVTNCPASSTVVSSWSAPASSAPASSAPTPSAPASSAPAPSAPASSAPAPSAPASSAPASSAPASSASGSACQTSLSGAYQTPHAIIPVNKQQPNTKYGTQYNAYVGGGNSTVFNFDIPQDYSGKQCSVIFLFPKQSQLETSSFTLSGSGGLTFEQLSSPAGLDVSYSSLPKVQSKLNEISNVTPGNSYVVSTGACAAGTTESIEVSSTGGLNLEFFEDWNPSPIGVFITSC